MKLQKQATGLMNLLTITLFLAFLSFNTKADITTYNWQRELKGYTIEEIPGSSPTEYVAVGTIYLNATINGVDVSNGIHFMRLDNIGNIICDKKFYNPISPDQYSSLKAIDVVVDNSNSFWVTVLYRGDNVDFAFDRDMIGVVHINNQCTILPNLNGHPITLISSTDPHYENLIPTHSLFENGHLFISGYATRASEKYPAVPTRGTSDKVGFVLKVDINAGINAGLNVVNAFEWNSPNTPVNSFDYDMPLRMKLTGNNFPPNILIVGAANSDVGSESNILLYELTNNLGIQAHNTIYFGVPMFNPNNLPYGPVGVDIVYNSINNEYYVLANHLIGDDYWQWSVTRTNSLNLIVANPSLPSSLLSAPSGSDFKANGMFNDGTIYGEQAGLHTGLIGGILCTTTVAPPHFNPSNVNFSPFLNFSSYSYNNLTGISKTPSLHQIQLSLNGTEFSYSGPGHFHDDFHNIFTSAAIDPTGGGYKIISPVLNTSNNLKNAKFTSTNSTGWETDCEATHQGCDIVFTHEYPTNKPNVLDFITINLTYDCNSYLGIVDDIVNVDEYHCSWGHYKKGKNTLITKNVTAISQNIFSIYPNPAKDVAYVSFVLNKSSTIAVQVIDALGRIVNNTSEQQYEHGYHKITLNTDNLAPGIYTIKMQTNNQSFTDRLTIVK